jgi:hypothetical protein
MSNAPPGKPREKTKMNRLKTIMLVAAVAALPLSAMAQATPASPAQPSAGAPATPATPDQKATHGGKHHGKAGAHGQKPDGAKAKKPGDSSSLDSNSNIQLAAAPFFKPVLGLGLN